MQSNDDKYFKRSSPPKTKEKEKEKKDTGLNSLR